MKSLASKRITTDEFLKTEDILRLWILRLLVPLGKSHVLLMSDGFLSDRIAEAIGLGHWLVPGAPEYDRNIINAELRTLHAEAEQYFSKALPPETLHNNCKRFATLINLDDTGLRIMEFVFMLHNSTLLESFSEYIGNISTTQLYRNLSVVLDIPEHEIKASLSCNGRLAASGIIRVDHKERRDLFRKFEVLSPSLPSRMYSTDTDPMTLMRDIITPCTPSTLTLDDYQHIKNELEIVVPYLQQAVAQRRKGVNIYIHGSPGTGKSQFARTLAKHIGCSLFEVTREDEDGDPISGWVRLSALRAAQCVLATGKSLLLFDEVEDIYGDSTPVSGKLSTEKENKGWMNRMLEENPVPTLWLSNSTQGLDPAFVRRFDMVFEIPIPPRRQREKIIHELCSDLLPADKIKRIANIETLAPAVVERASNVVKTISSHVQKGQAPIILERLINNTLSTQGHGEIKKNDLTRLPSWYDPGFINADTDLAILADGLDQHQSGRLCLYGPPGTGKTAFGRWLADQLGLPLLTKRASDLISGSSAKSVGKLNQIMRA